MIVAQNSSPPPTADQDDFVDPVSHTVQTIADLHVRAERKVPRSQRAVEAATAFVGRPRFLFLTLGFVAVWVAINETAHLADRTAFDVPPFFWLQGLVALSALLMTTMVLITTNRQARLAERRAQLDLQINLLTEQKITKLIALIEELRRDLPNVHNRDDPEAERMQEAADPHAVLVALDHLLSDDVSEAVIATADAEEGAAKGTTAF